MNKILYILFVFCLTTNLSAKAQVCQLALKDASSLVRVGMNPHPVSEGDTVLAYQLLSAIDRRDIDSLKYICSVYREKANNDKMKEKAWGALSYIIDRMIKESQGETIKERNLLSEDLYRYFSDNEFAHLRNYLVIKYELNNYRPRSVKEHINQRTFYDDFLMYNDPGRAEWDKTDIIMSRIPLSKGQKVLDMGCGFGYNAMQLAGVVGATGTVYATDTEDSYIKHFSSFVKRNDIRNVIPVTTRSNDIGVNDSLDCIFMSSLYHIIYTWSREDERSALISSIRQRLKTDGYIAIVDNYNLNGEELNNCHVNPNLVIAQLGFWGFKPVEMSPLSSQRYLLVMQRDDNYVVNRRVESEDNIPVITINDRKSIVHIGSLDSYDITDRGIDAAQYVYDFMGGGDKSLAEIAISKYNDLIPLENFGGEYSALQWLCEAKTADDETRNRMLEDPLSRSFYHYLTDDSCKTLRYYLLHKYKLGNDSIRMLSDSLLEMSGEVGRTHRSYLEDYILALNPKREDWENTSKIMRELHIGKGETIADIGCGSGFFSARFSREVGDKGLVYAIELKDEHIERLTAYVKENDISNISIVKGKEDVFELPEKVDKMFMCSLYHIMYGVIPDNIRDGYFRSLLRHLKKDGELIIVDNGPVDNDKLPYHGPYITPELIINQLSFYGLELKEYVQIIPQRYMLKFKFR